MRTRRVNIFFKKSYLFLLEFHSEQVTLVELAQVIIANTMDGVGHTTGTCVLTVLGAGEAEARVRVPASWLSGEGSLLGLQMVAFPPCLHGLLFMCMEREGASSLVCGAPPSCPHPNLITSRLPVPSRWGQGFGV